MPDNTGGDSPKPGWLTRKIYETNAEKKKDFWLGVGMFFGLNIILSLCYWGLFVLMVNQVPMSDPTSGLTTDLYTMLSCILNLIPWIVNIVLLIYFSFMRSQIALGMVAGFGIALALGICLGVIFMVVCFVSLNGSGF